jgi:CelD/BcsL family acetyltransferase involved in cellulose biosynthesis
VTNVAAAVAAPFASAYADEAVVYEDPGALEALAPAWDRLARTPMQQSIWARAWAHTFGGRYSFRISTAGAPDFPAAIAPLVSSGRVPTRYELVGSDLNESMDVLGSDEGAIAAIAEELARSKAPLLLPRVPAGSLFVSAVCKAYAGSLVVVRRAPGTPYLALDEGWLEPERGFDATGRFELRRARQQMESVGEVSIDLLSPSPGEAEKLLDEAFALWKVEGLHGAFARRYAEAAARRGILRLSFLRVGGSPAAVQLAVEFADRFWVLRHSSDRTFARYSPDKLLMLETIRLAAQSGLEAYELLGGRETWAGLTPELEHEAVSVRTYTPGFRGLGVLAVDGAGLAERGWRALRGAGSS